MKKINIEETTTFDLEMEIHGDIPRGVTGNLYFTVITEKMRLSFEGKCIESGVYRISIPPLKNIIESGKYQFEVEVLIDGKHFKPISESIEFVEEIKPTVRIKETDKENLKESSVSVKIGEIKESTKTKPLDISKAKLQRIGKVVK
jgi:hypothetical protein